MYLYWLEALSLLGTISEGIFAILELDALLLVGSTSTSYFLFRINY
jgi:hypothetical protein